MDELPVRTSGKVDKAALPWPLPATAAAVSKISDLNPVERWLSEIWAEVLAVPAPSAASDFFAPRRHLPGSGQRGGRIRRFAPQVAVRDLYDHPRLGRLAEELTTRGLVDAAALGADAAPTPGPEPKPVGRATRWSGSPDGAVAVGAARRG